MLSLPEEAPCQLVLPRCSGLSPRPPPHRQHAFSKGGLLEFVPPGPLPEQNTEALPQGEHESHGAGLSTLASTRQCTAERKGSDLTEWLLLLFACDFLQTPASTW